MDEDTKDLDMSLEEHTAEEEATKEVSEDELREKLAEDLGLDPDEDADILDKVVEREKIHNKKLSGALKQKISWREKYQSSTKPQDKPTESKAQSQEAPEDFDERVERKLMEKLEERDLESLGLPEDLKAEVRDFAKFKGISVKEASQHSYILLRKKEAEDEVRVKEATPKRTRKGSYSPGYDPSKPLNPEDFDFDSEEGVKAWKEAREARDRHRAKNNS